MSTTAKTPVSMLNEMLVRKNLQPMYNLLMSGVGSNQGIFVYEVTAGDLVKARGRGRSKKEAKQDAAKVALEKIKSGFRVTDISPDTSLEEEGLQMTNIDVISPYQAQMKENAVGSLNELCAGSQMPAPVYHQIREDGPPHAKLFELACRVSSFEHCAVGRTKQQAKQLAAKLMLETLEKLKIFDSTEPTVPQESKGETPEERAQLMASIHAARSSRGLNTLPTRHLLGHQMGGPFKHDWPEEKIAQIKVILEPQPTDSLVQMERICTQLDLKMSFLDIASIEKGKNLCVLSVSTQPENCFLGAGPSPTAAHAASAVCALKFFSFMSSM